MTPERRAQSANGSAGARRRDLSAWLVLICVFFFVLPVAAQDKTDAARDREIAQVDLALEAIRDKVDEDGAVNVRETEQRLRELIAESRSRLTPVVKALETAEQSLDQLGPAPAEGEPPESEPIAERREELRRKISVLQGQRTRILSNIDEAGALLASLSARRVAFLYRNLLQSETPLLAPALWREGAQAAGAVVERSAAYFSAWRSRDGAGLDYRIRLGLLLGAIVFSMLLIGPVHWWMQNTFTRRIEAYEPTSGRRVAVAGVKMLSRIIPGIIGGLTVIGSARAIGLLVPEGMALAYAVWGALLAYLLVEGFTSGLFSPPAPSWRIADVDAAKGKRASRLFLTIVIVFGAKTVLAEVVLLANSYPALLQLLAGTSAVTIGALLIVLSHRRLWTRDGASPEAGAETKQASSPGLWPHIRRSGWVIGALIIAAAIAGYISLADFAASRLYYLSLILSVAWFVRASLTEIGVWAERRLRGEKAAAEEKDDREIARFWIRLAVDFILVCALIPAILVLVGFGWRSVRDIVANAFLGVRIGGFTLSFADIFWAVGIFFVVLAITRFVQRGLERGPFAHSRLDVGVQDSLRTLLGYLGLLIAAVAAVTAIGVDLSNLALIAGALSVGVGFGLQSIVNNFVSGLILLFERPIKAGDWVVTTSGEGTVRKISFRSTEIETFDRSTIIVPNSELISSSVINWTHRSKLGRITIPVGVSYSADPEQVRDILLKCAREHPLIVGYPEPFVVWKDFGDSALLFEIRAYIRDIINGLTVRTDLRFAIFKELKEAGIEIPFPQRDLHLKSWPDAPPPGFSVPENMEGEVLEPEEAVEENDGGEEK